MAIEVHKSQKEDTLFYRVGTVNAADRTVSWGASQKYDSGKAPSIALNDAGVLVEVHGSQNENTLWAHVAQARTYP